MQQGLDRRAYETRLIEHHIRLHCRRNINQMSDGPTDAVHHGDGVRISALLHHRKIDGTLPVNMDHVVLQSMGILKRSHVRHQNRILAVHFDGILAGILQIELCIRIDVVVQISDLNVACGKNNVRLVERSNDVHRTNLSGLEFERIDVKLDLPPRSTEWLRDRCAGNTCQLIPNEVLCDVL